MRILTIGVYGFTAESFRKALESTAIGIFVDTRRRRSVRGHDYAFANSQRLQHLLAELGIPYVHRLDLAPSEATIHVQNAADHDAGILRRDRDHLSAAFQHACQGDVMDGFDASEFIASLGTPSSILLFCVEGLPNACHRSLLAARLETDLGATVEHIVP